MKKIPIGVSDFKKLHENNCYFVDKTLLIKDIIDDGSEVVLFTRPRRFGKTLNLSMIYYYFDCDNATARAYFESLAIWQQGDVYQQQRGKYPVISLSLKDVKATTFADALQRIGKILQEVYAKYSKVLLNGSLLTEKEKIEYQHILDRNTMPFELSDSLLNLTKYLHQHYGTKPILLIDEYDSPIHAGFSNDYYQDIALFMRDLLSSALKDNLNLHKGVLTGILRVAKESIFSGLNHLKVYSIIEQKCAHHYGFTQAEVDLLLHDMQCSTMREDIQTWYNGYSFGNDKIYNPWSILECVSNNGVLRPYWVNTSDNALILKLIASTPTKNKAIFEAMLQGEPYRARLESDVTFPALHQQDNVLWNFLLHTGYLSVQNIAQDNTGFFNSDFVIPNKEIRLLYFTLINRWFGAGNIDLDHTFVQSLVRGDIATFKKLLATFLSETFSYFDTQGKTKEQIYHVFVLGLIAGLTEHYIIRSNREAGDGRYDVVMLPKDKNQLGIIFEFKALDNNADDAQLKQAASEVLQQIQQNQYLAEFQQNGITNVLPLGIAFAGKHVEIVTDNSSSQADQT